MINFEYFKSINDFFKNSIRRIVNVRCLYAFERLYKSWEMLTYSHISKRCLFNKLVKYSSFCITVLVLALVTNCKNNEQESSSIDSMSHISFTNETMWVRNDYVMFRSKPDRKSPPLGMFNIGDKLEDVSDTGKKEVIGNKTGSWASVKYNGKSGFVFSPFLITMEDAMKITYTEDNVFSGKTFGWADGADGAEIEFEKDGTVIFKYTFRSDNDPEYEDKNSTQSICKEFTGTYRTLGNYVFVQLIRGTETTRDYSEREKTVPVKTQNYYVFMFTGGDEPGFDKIVLDPSNSVSEYTSQLTKTWEREKYN